MTTCPLCGASWSMLERMAGPGRWFCNGCGFVYTVDDSGIVVHGEPTTKSRTAPRSAFKEAVRAFFRPMNPVRVVLPKHRA